MYYALCRPSGLFAVNHDTDYFARFKTKKALNEFVSADEKHRRALTEEEAEAFSLANKKFEGGRFLVRKDLDK